MRPRRQAAAPHFDEAALAELAESIKSEGVVQPIVVRELASRLRDHRRRAPLAGSPEGGTAHDPRGRAPQRRSRQPGARDGRERGAGRPQPGRPGPGYAVLSDELDLTQTEIARRVGKSRAAVANTMRLLELPDAVLDLISTGHAVRGPRPGDPAGRGPGRAARAGAQGCGQAGTLGAPDRGRGQATPPSARRLRRRRPGSMDDELANLVVDAAWASLNLKAACAAGRAAAGSSCTSPSNAELGRIIDQCALSECPGPTEPGRQECYPARRPGRLAQLVRAPL